MSGDLRLDDWLLTHLQDPEARAEWERTAVARAVAIWLIGYRADQGRSIEDLARQLGTSVDAVTELEIGEVEPSRHTLLEIARALEVPLRLPIERGLPGERVETVVIGGSAEIATTPS